MPVLTDRRWVPADTDAPRPGNRRAFGYDPEPGPVTPTTRTLFCRDYACGDCDRYGGLMVTTTGVGGAAVYLPCGCSCHHR